MASSDPVTVNNLVLKVETDGAFGVDAGSDDIVWIPKSQVEAHTLFKDEKGTAVMPKWLADKNDFEYEE